MIIIPNIKEKCVTSAVFNELQISSFHKFTKYEQLFPCFDINHHHPRLYTY